MLNTELKELQKSLKEEKEKDMTREEKILAKQTSDIYNVGFGKEVLKRRNANKLASKQRKQNKKK